MTHPQHGQSDPRQWQQHGAPVPPFTPPTYAPTPKRRRRWPWVLAVVVLLFAVVGLATGEDDDTPAAGTLTSPAMPSGTAPESEPAKPADPETSFGDGTYVVGEDIAPGTYRTPGAREGVFEYCQITTHSDENADADKTLDWKNGNAGDPIRVKVGGKVKSVKVTGCEPFTKVD